MPPCVYASLYHPGYTTLLGVRVASGNGTQKGAIAHLLTLLVSSASGLTLGNPRDGPEGRGGLLVSPYCCF